MYFDKRMHVLLFATVLLSACAGKPDASNAHEDRATWQQMDDFHTVMAETFHPYKDSANLEPARRRATELMLSAQAWASAPLPERLDDRAMQNKLEVLASEAEVLAERVKSADDNAVAEQLTQVHDTFHEIQEAWYDAQ